MEDIFKQIKALEKEAREAKYWKDRYDDLKKEVERVIQPLTNMMNIKVTNSVVKTKPVSSYVKVAESIYLDMLKDDNLQVGTDYIKKKIEDSNYKSYAGFLSGVRDLLRKKKNVFIRRDGLKMYFFYQKMSGEENDKIKFEKVSFMR